MRVVAASVAGGSVDEFVGVPVERPVLDQLEVEVGCAPEDRVGAGRAGNDGEDGHLPEVEETGGHQRPVQPQAAVRPHREVRSQIRP
jgi:hypothetical protein